MVKTPLNNAAILLDGDTNAVLSLATKYVVIVLFVCLKQRNATKYKNKLCLTKYKKVLRNNNYYNNNKN